MAAHCSVDIAAVPESVSKSIRIDSEGIKNKLYPASSRRRWRSPDVVRRIGSTLLIRNGSMIVLIGIRASRTLESRQENTQKRGAQAGSQRPLKRAIP